MRWIRPGSFTMGSNRHYPEERPEREVTVAGFWMSDTPVTNRGFERFVEATGYTTVAERDPHPAEFPLAAPELLVPGSAVFTPTEGPVPLSDELVWWKYVPGASWRHPEGPLSTVAHRLDHPVVHVAYEDARAYADWAEADLPTEAEWEYAARGGSDGTVYPWGDEFAPGGRHLANTWQGSFPCCDTADDGFAGTSPAGAFPANGYGLFDMIGNVWEWATPAEDATVAARACCAPARPSADPRRVIKGGSYLCTDQYCARYRPAARQLLEPSSSTSHVGFRCVSRAPGPRA